jgi:DNA replication protein DnaC
MYERSLIPKRFWGKTLSNYRPGRGQGSREGYDAAGAYIDKLVDHREDGTGITFLGPPGVGKTMLLALVGMAAVEKGYDVLFMPLAKYIRLELNMIRWEKHQADEDIVEDWTKLRQKLLDIRNKVEFLLLDDVGKEHITETHFAEDEFDFLFRNRFDLGLPTLITSNTPVEAWAKTTVNNVTRDHYGPAMASFLIEAAPVIEMHDADFRPRLRP